MNVFGFPVFCLTEQNKVGLYAEEEILRAQRYRRKGRIIGTRSSSTQRVRSTEEMEIQFLTVGKLIPLKWRQ